MLHMADVHLGAAQYNIKEREKDVYKAFREAVEKALEERVDAVVISGDLFHTPTPTRGLEPVKVAEEEISKLREKGIEVIMIPGDHDKPKRFGLPSIKYVADKTGAKLLLKDIGLKGVEVKGVRFYGVQAPAYGNYDELKALGKVKKPRKSVVLLHLAPCSLFRFSCVDDGLIPKGFTYYAMGHIHAPITNYFDNAPMIFPGSLEVINVDEVKYIDEKGPILVDLSGDEAKVLGRIKIRVRPQVILKVDFPLNEKKFLTELSKIPKGSVVHVYAKGSSSYGLEKLKVLLSQRDILTWRIHFVSEKYEEEEEVSVVGVPSVVDVIKRYYKDEKLASHLAQLFEALGSDSNEALAIAEELFKSGLWKRSRRF